ncbi:MAG: hypothetical protein JNK45_24010 [Myxococcales bacterium]|nr:hypothetical protein [Myxococcales bacterium]
MRRRPAPVLLSLALAVGLGVTACKPRPTAAPYAPGQGPKAEALIAGAKPQLDAVAVPDAKVIANRVLRGNLAFLAQEPGRFRGSVQVSGNELVTLALTEEGYALRYKLDAFPTGFYHGPPSACAVEALLGVALDAEDLVALVLGGAPVIAEPYEIVEQGWDSAAGREAVTIRNGRFVQRLDFAKLGDTWQFAGSKLWQRKPDGSRGAWIWSLAHEDMARHGDAMLPARTRVLAPGKRKDNLLVIQYKSRDLDPAFAKQAGDGGNTTDGGNPTDGGTPTDDGGDDWGGADGWEGEDGGAWEGAEGAEPKSDPAPEPPAQPPAASPKTAAPKVFTIDGTGLGDRGDLCRPH